MSYDVLIFGIKLTLSPVAFSIPLGGNKHWDVYWYGIIIAVGFLLCLLYGMKNAKRFGVDPDKMIDVVLITTPIAILCARLYYVLFDGKPLNSIGEFFGVGNSSGFSGLAIFGGVLGAFGTGALLCKLFKINILDMFDLAATAFLIGQGIGRWGNFINQEAYGSFTYSSWWGMESNKTIAEVGVGLVHPCFLYESIWCIAGFFILNHFSKLRRMRGENTLLYCVWYGFGRGIIELLRTDSLGFAGIRISCVLAFALCITGIILLFILRHARSEQALAFSYESMLADEIERDEEIAREEAEEAEKAKEVTEEATEEVTEEAEEVAEEPEAEQVTEETVEETTEETKND